MKYKSILIAVDGSECSKNAAAKGINLANQLSASVILLYVIDMTSAISSTAVSGTVNIDMIKMFYDEAERVVKEIVGKYPSVTINTLTLEGIPSYEIRNVAKSKNTDMIIMGTHGRTGLKHLVLGSVAEDVIRHAEIPVLVIPATKEAKQ